MNESRMIWMTVEWCEWLLNDRNESEMRRMTKEWCGRLPMIWMSLEWDEGGNGDNDDKKW